MAPVKSGGSSASMVALVSESVVDPDSSPATANTMKAACRATRPATANARNL